MMLLYYLFLVLSYTRNFVSYSHSFGNQLEQYEKYKKDIHKEVKLSHLADECFTVDLSNFHKCSSSHILQLRKQYHPLWNGEVDLNQLANPLNQSIIDCNYNVIDSNEFKIYDNKIDILFEIIQSECKSLYSHLGGSSFEVSVMVDRYLLVCGVFDLFNNKYLVNCSMPLEYVSNDLKLCMKTTVYLDYEHYDAISDIPFNLNVKHKYMIMNDGNICRNLSSIQFNTVGTHSNDWIWQRNNNFRNDFDIKGSFAIFPKKCEFANCTANKKLVFIGASHMRFNWDYLISSYVDPKFPLQLERKHGDILMFPKYQYYVKRFSADIPTLLKQLAKGSCQNMDEEYNIIIQVGTWDLEFWPLSNFIDNHKNGQALLSSLKELQNSCGNIKLIWVTTVPEEATMPNAENREFYSSNNNYKKHAAMQWILKKMNEVGWKKYKIIDAFSLVIPLVTDDRNHVVCKNHFLCHEYGLDDMSVTSPGKAVLSHILNSVCEDFISYNDQIVNDKVIRSEEKLNELYIVHMGIKRYIQDESTFLKMDISKSEIVTQSSIDFNDIVSGRSFPIWKDYWLILYQWTKYYMVYNGSTYYLGLKNEVDNCFIKQNSINVDAPEIVDNLDLSILPQNSNILDIISIFNLTRVTTVDDKKCNIHFEIHKNGSKAITSSGQDCIWTLSTEDFDSIPYADEVQKNLTINARENGGYFSDGTLIQRGTNPEIYIYQNNSIFLIPNLKTFMALGRDFSEVIRVSPSCLNQVGVIKELV